MILSGNGNKCLNNVVFCLIFDHEIKSHSKGVFLALKRTVLITFYVLVHTKISSPTFTDGQCFQIHRVEKENICSNNAKRRKRFLKVEIQSGIIKV